MYVFNYLKMKKLLNILIIFFLISSNVFAADEIEKGKTLFWMGEELTVDEYNKRKAGAEAKSKEIKYTFGGKEVTKEEYERLKAQRKKEISDTVNKKLEKYGHSSNMDIDKKNSFYKEYNNNSNSNTSNKDNSNIKADEKLKKQLVDAAYNAKLCVMGNQSYKTGLRYRHELLRKDALNYINRNDLNGIRDTIRQFNEISTLGFTASGNRDQYCRVGSTIK